MESTPYDISQVWVPSPRLYDVSGRLHWQESYLDSDNYALLLATNNIKQLERLHASNSVFRLRNAVGLISHRRRRSVAVNDVIFLIGWCVCFIQKTTSIRSSTESGYETISSNSEGHNYIFFFSFAFISSVQITTAPWTWKNFIFEFR